MVPPNNEGSLPPSEQSTVTEPPPVSGDSPHIGQYRLLQKVGEGGMGEVWLAEQKEPLRRRVALKIIKPGMDTKTVIARFEQERQALAMMDHPCVAKVFDAGATPEGRPYFVMEYVQGSPIDQHCDRHKFSTGDRLELFAQVCDGVQHAHQKAIIHRDLKPSNVLVTIQGAKACPKIIDFGVAKATAHRLTEASLFTELGMLVGTPEYMSPEQADPTLQDVDTRTDVYSLGVMLYELLVGALPFEPQELRRAGLESIRRMIREVEPPKPSVRLLTLGDEKSTDAAGRRRVDVRTLHRLLKGDLDWITMKALEKDRTRRYGSPAEMAADIVRHLRHEPVIAGPPSATYRLRKFVRRHRFGVVTASLGVLVPIAFGVAMGVQARRTAQEARAKAQVARFLEDLFIVSDPSMARGNSITARELLDRGAERIRESLKNDPRVRADMMMMIGGVYRNLGLYAPAEPLLEEGMQIRQRLLGADHPDTLWAASSVGWLYLLQGKYQEAEALQREALERSKRALGPEHFDTLAAMSNLANSYLGQGRIPEAEALYREELEISTRALGSQHPNTLAAMSNLAVCYSSQGRHKEAEALYRDNLEASKRILGPEHPETLKPMGNLAHSYYDQGRYAEAEALGRKVLDISKRVLGPEHPETLTALSFMASTDSAQGRYLEAEALDREVLEIQKRVLGPEHPDTLSSMYNLGCSAALRGDRAGALAYLRMAVDGGLAMPAMTSDPDLQILYGEPEFEALAAQALKNQEGSDTTE